MHRAPRVVRSIDSLGVIVGSRTPPPFLCYACKYRTSFFSTSAVEREQKDGQLPWSESFRRRIWGTDNPPGQKDPYSKSDAGGNIPKAEIEVVSQTEERETNPRKAPKSVEIDPDYEPATTWEGLESVGGFNHAARKEEWDALHPFNGFLPADVLTDPDEVTVAVRRALVEVIALKLAGLPLNIVSQEASGEDLTQTVQVLVSEKTGASLGFSEGTKLDHIVKSLGPSGTEVKEKGVTTLPILSPKELIGSWDPSWLQVSLADPEIKFAVIKRSLQLTGIRLPDSSINSVTTTQSLLDRLAIPPKSPTLAEVLEEKEDLLDLPNVKMHSKRISMVQKEKSIGRWKLIQKELVERGLSQRQIRKA